MDGWVAEALRREVDPISADHELAHARPSRRSAV